MNRATFFEAASRLANWVENLSNQAESSLIHVEDELCQKRELAAGEPPSRAIVAMEIEAIAERITEVMCAYDDLCQAAGITRHFELAFRVMDASRHMRWKVKQVLDGNEAALLPRTPDRPATNLPPSANGESP